MLADHKELGLEGSLEPPLLGVDNQDADLVVDGDVLELPHTSSLIRRQSFVSLVDGYYSIH